MREIIFRAKYEDVCQWVYGDLIHKPFGVCIHCLANGRRTLSKIDERTICRYTGLTDKNGNKIWEKDIVAISGEEEIFIISWDIERAAFVIKSDTLQYDFNSYRGSDLEVIGNVFDNANLLEVQV